MQPIKKSKKVWKIIGLVAGILALVAALMAVASFVFSHMAVQDFRREASAQIREFNETGQSGEAVKLRFVPLGNLVNPSYQRLTELQTEYEKLYKVFQDYYGDKNRYEKDVNEYNARIKAGEDVDDDNDLNERRKTLQQDEEKLDEDLKNLQEKLNNL
jgi:chromosome segregation ATPase